MVDGINFNPFTGKAFSTDEINRLDTNKDGIISGNEFTAGISWLSAQGKDEDGDVAIEDNSKNSDDPVYQKMISAVSNKTPSNSTELQEEVTVMSDEFIEAYLKDKSLTNEEKQSIVSALKTGTDEFVKEFLKNNPQGPYDTAKIASELLPALQKSAANYDKTKTDSQNTLASLSEDSSKKFDDMADYAKNAGSDYLKTSEFNELKNKTVDYILSTLYNSEPDTELLANMNSKYANNSNYQLALKAVNSLKNETDPEKIQKLITEAKNYLNSFIGSSEASKNNLLNAIETTATDRTNSSYKSSLENINDKMCEKFSNSYSNKNDATLEKYIEFTKNVLDSFLAQYNGDGANIETEYSTYLNKLIAERNGVISETINFAGAEFSRDLNLGNAVESAGKYISKKEADVICSKFSEIALESLLTESTDMLKAYDSSFASNEYYVAAKALMDGLYTSASPSEDLAKIKDLLSKYSESLGADKIKAGYESDQLKQKQLKASATPNYQDSSLTDGLAHYGTNTTYGNDQKINYKYSVDENGAPQLNNNLDNIDYQKTMNELKTRLQEKYKVIMGDAYDETLVNACINEAMVNALEIFCSNSQTVPEAARKNGSRKGDNYKCNMSDIVNQTLYETDKVVAQKIPASNTNKIDGNAAIESAGLKDTLDDKSFVFDNPITGKSDIETSKLKVLRNAVMIQAKAKLGDKYDEAAVNLLLDSAQSNTMSLLKSQKKLTLTNSYIYNTFFSQFNKLLTEYMVTNKLY